MSASRIVSETGLRVDGAAERLQTGLARGVEVKAAAVAAQMDKRIAVGLWQGMGGFEVGSAGFDDAERRVLLGVVCGAAVNKYANAKDNETDVAVVGCTSVMDVVMAGMHRYPSRARILTV